MKAYLLTPEELAEEARMVADAGLDEITIMDSAGTMLPEEAETYVRAVLGAVSIPSPSIATITSAFPWPMPSPPSAAAQACSTAV